MLEGFMATKHFQMRCSQRGVNDWKIRIVIKYIKPERKRGANIYVVRNKDIERMIRLGVINNQQADKLCNLVVVAAIDSFELITVYYASQKTLRKIMQK